MILALLFLFGWPWSHPHIEKFTVTISSDGKTSYTFKHRFKAAPVCTSTGKGLEWYPDRVIVYGKSGDVVSVTCK